MEEKKALTPEEYIKSKAEGSACYHYLTQVVPEHVALSALEDLRTSHKEEMEELKLEIKLLKGIIESRK